MNIEMFKNFVPFTLYSFLTKWRKVRLRVRRPRKEMCVCKIVGLTLILLMWRIGWANSIPIHIQQDASLRSLFKSGNYSTRFGWYFHPSSGAHTPVSTASVICHTVTAFCRYQLEPVWVCCGWRTPPTAHSNRFQLIAADSSNGMTNTWCCRYSCLRSWWWLMVPPETCRAVSRCK
jgi:hypothetical protein